MSNKKKYIIAIVAFIICSIMFSFAIKAQRMYADNLTNKAKVTEESKEKANDNKGASNTSEQSKKSPDSSKEKEDAKSTAKDQSDSKSTSAQSSSNTTSKDNKSTTTSTSDSNSQVDKTEQSSKSKESVKEANPEEAATFVFIDTVNGNRVILQKKVDLEGETVGYITCRLLDEAKIKYKTTGSASTLYFAAIDGLEEKKAGRLSGWCYYVKKKGDTRFHKPNVGSGQWVYKKGDLVVWKYLADGIHDGYSDDWDK